MSEKHYRKRPVVITARQMHEAFRVETLEGVMRGKAGDWLITGVRGEQYPCDDEIFRETYEEVTDGAPAYTEEERKLLATAERHFSGREVICPKCGAGVGVPCRGREGLRSHPAARGSFSVGSHIERVELARRLEDTRVCK